MFEARPLFVEFVDGHDDLLVADSPKITARITLVDELKTCSFRVFG